MKITLDDYTIGYDGLNYSVTAFHWSTNKKTGEKKYVAYDNWYCSSLSHALMVISKHKLKDESIDSVDKLLKAIKKSTRSIEGFIEKLEAKYEGKRIEEIAGLTK